MYPSLGVHRMLSPVSRAFIVYVFEEDYGLKQQVHQKHNDAFGYHGLQDTALSQAYTTGSTLWA